MSGNRLFPLKIESTRYCLLADVKDPSWLWHFRYGHLNFGGLQALQKKNMVLGLPQIAIPSKVCENMLSASNIVLYSLKESPGEQKRFSSSFIPTFVAR